MDIIEETPNKTAFQELVTEAIEEAYAKLSPEEAQIIDDICTQMEINVKAKRYPRRSSHFGYQSALELAAKLGIFLAEKKIPKPILEK